jgi:hypothetical protein
MKLVSTSHSLSNIWNGLTVVTAISREKRKPVSEEMATPPTDRSCDLEFARCNSFVAVESAFRRQFGRRGY